MTRDPKFGYHVIWIVPLMLLWHFKDYVVYKVTNTWICMMKKYINWRYPELKKLQRLSGVKTDKNEH